MSAPSGLLGAAVLFWGWQVGLLALAVPMAAAYEAARLAKGRLDLSRPAFHRISDVCTTLFAAMALYAYTSMPSPAAVMAMFKWLPITFLPLMAAQLYSTQGRVDVSTFFLSFRARAEETGPRKTIDISVPYALVCVLAASAANDRTPLFYSGMFVLAAWTLWFTRPRAAPASIWIALMAAAGAAGWWGQITLHNMQEVVERAGVRLVFGIPEVGGDPYRRSTAIGSIGSIKQSGRVLLRVRGAEGRKPPPLLRAAAFNDYRSGRWVARKAEFSEVRAGSSDASWDFGTAPRKHDRVGVTMYLRRGSGILALPGGAYSVENLPAVMMRRSRLGTVKVDEGPGFASYEALHSPLVSLDGKPRDSDLGLSKLDAPVFEKLAGELGLREMPARKAMRAVADYFSEGFEYSVYQKEDGGSRPLETFLHKTRSGHCEYFATATVLLLRAGGVPARYVTGYSVAEYSDLEKAFVVRQRHAHAWARAYAGGKWLDVDTTPASWLEVERDRASGFEKLGDFWAWLRHGISEWRWSRSEGSLAKRFSWLLIPLSAFLFWRMYGSLKSARLRRESSTAGRAPELPGRDSEFYEIEAALAETGRGRHPWETVSAWLDRIGETGSLGELAALHARYRFDPEGITASERSGLRSGTREWLRRSHGGAGVR